MALYKYVTAERIDVLQNGLIRFTQASALNDPWDMRPHVERLFGENDLQRMVDPLMPKSDEQLIDSVSQMIDNFAKAKGLPDKSLNEIKRLVIEANDAFPGELRQLLDSAYTETLEEVKKVVPDLAGVVPEAMDKAAGVLSLTGRPDHPLMWSHYAESHAGFVLGLDETHQFFRSPRYGKEGDMGSPRKVKYSLERPRFDSFIDMSLIDSTTDEDAEAFFDKLFFTKSQIWDYEEEWRMIKGLKQAERVLENPMGNVYLFSIPAACIVSVMLGQRMALETKQRLIDFLRTDERYTHVNVFQAKSTSDKFTIEIQPLDLP